MPKDEIKDTLESTQSSLVLDLICEGPIEGLKQASKSGYNEGGENYRKESLKDIYLNGTPILKRDADVTNLSDANYNFQDVTFRYRLGKENQSDINFFDQIQREISVNVKVTKENGPVTRRITDELVDAVRVTLTWPRLYRLGSLGEYKPRTVNYKIQVNYGGKWETIKDVELTGLTTNQYQRDHNLKLDRDRFNVPGDFVDIRVRRVTDDDDPATGQDFTEFFWTSYTEKVKAKLSYPFSVLIGLEFQAKDFSTVPARSYWIRGLKIKIPSNATVKPNSGRITYSGAWDGTFAAGKAWTADPAWILYNLLTNKKHGLGDEIIEANLDKFSFYAASQYCNELVPSMDPDDEDDTEPRFSCNLVIQNFQEAYNAINDLASIFRAMPYWSAGAIDISQDKPGSSVYLFNLSNVSEEGFSYSGSSQKTRHSVAIVKWFRNSTQNFDYEVVEDSKAYSFLGYKPVTLEAIGVRTRGQARRVGEWLLYSENYDTEVVSFTSTMAAGIQVRPGNIISIQDPLRTGVRRGGRILSSTSNTITIDEDASTDLPVGANPTVQITNDDGTVSLYSVTGVAADVITVSGTISPTPLVGGSFLYSDDDLGSTDWRVLSITEKDSVGYTISAVKYNESKYDFIERDRPLVDQDYLPTDSGTTLNGVGAITAVVQEVTYQGISSTEVLIGWQTDPNAVSYVISIQETATTEIVSTNFYQILPATFDTYNVTVYSVGPTGSTSSTSTAIIEVNNILNAPNDPIDLTVVQQDATNALLTFTQSSDGTVTSGGFVVIRHSPLLVGATWENATELAQVAGSSTSAIVPLLTGTYFIKFLNNQGFYSTSSASDTLTAEEIAPELPIETIEEGTP